MSGSIIENITSLIFDLIIIFVSFLWEGIEEFLGHVFENNSIVMPFNKIQKDVKYKRWWHGSLRDVLYNLSGYYLAKFLVQYYDINIKIPGINQIIIIPYENNIINYEVNFEYINWIEILAYVWAFSMSIILGSYILCG